MKKVATIAHGRGRMYLDQKDDSYSRLLKVPVDKVFRGYELQLLIDYEAILLEILWEFHDTVDPNGEQIAGWSTLPVQDSEGGLHIKEKPSSKKGKDITSDFVPLVQFLERTKIDAKAALVIAHQVIALAAILKYMRLYIVFQPDKWLINADNLRMVICDLSTIYKCTDRYRSMHKPVTKDLVSLLKTSIVPYDDDFADTAALLTRIEKCPIDLLSTMDDVYYGLRRAEHCHIQKDGNWQECQINLGKLDKDDLAKWQPPSITEYVLELARWAIFSDLQDTYDVEITSIGYGLDQWYPPGALGRENMAWVTHHSNLYNSVDPQTLVNHLRDFSSQMGEYCYCREDAPMQLVIYTNLPLGTLPEPEDSTQTLFEIVSNLSCSRRVHVFVTDKSLRDSWRKYFGTKHVTITSEQGLEKSIEEVFRNYYHWHTFTERYNSDYIHSIKPLLPLQKIKDDVFSNYVMLENLTWNWSYVSQ